MMDESDDEVEESKKEVKDEKKKPETPISVV